MKKEDKIVKLETEFGVIEMNVVKEFSHKNNKYAILTEAGDCSCDNDCDCDDKDCKCDDDCCSDDKCDDSCSCGCGGYYLFKVVKDKNNKESYEQIEENEELKDIIEEVEKVLAE